MTSISSHRYTGGFEYALGTTDASISIDTTISCPDVNSIVAGRDELVFGRDGDAEDAAWVGPIVGVADQPKGVLLITARDRSHWVTSDRNGRSWKRSRLFSGDVTDLVAAAFIESNRGDHIGIDQIDANPIGEQLDRELVAGRRLREVTELYSQVAPWTCIGGTIYVGFIEHDTQLELLAEHFAVGATPTISDNLLARVNRANVELPDGSVVSFPDLVSDVDVGTDGALLERTLDLSNQNLTAAEGAVIARALVNRGRHGMFIAGTAPVSPLWPIALQDIRPGLLVGASGPLLGSDLDIGDTLQVSTVQVGVEDDVEVSMTVALGPQFLDQRPATQGFVLASP